MGPSAGGAVYSPAITDFVFMVRGTAFMYVTGPDIVYSVTKEKVTHDELGGIKPHTTKSGVVHKAFENDVELLHQTREFLGFLPLSNREKAPKVYTSDSDVREDAFLDHVIPPDANMPYDMKHVIKSVVDEGNFFEIMEDWAKNIVVGFGRMSGETVCIIANQPKELAGCLDINASVKAARLIRFANAFNIPVITFVDVPGFLPGTQQENGGIIRNGAKLCFAYAEADVPCITVTTRKSYGGAYCVLKPKHLRGDYCYAWPTAELAVMGPEGAVKILTHGELGNGTVKEKENVYRTKFATPLLTAERGWMDDIIAPRTTRRRIISDLKILKTKKFTPIAAKKIGNIPL